MGPLHPRPTKLHAQDFANCTMGAVKKGSAGTWVPSGPCSSSPASYSEVPAVGLPSIATTMSRGWMPALSAGPPLDGVITCARVRAPGCHLSLRHPYDHHTDLERSKTHVPLCDCEHQCHGSQRRKTRCRIRSAEKSNLKRWTVRVGMPIEDDKVNSQHVVGVRTHHKLAAGASADVEAHL